jgi:hypothetical protein
MAGKVDEVLISMLQAAAADGLEDPPGSAQHSCSMSPGGHHSPDRLFARYVAHAV